MCGAKKIYGERSNQLHPNPDDDDDNRDDVDVEVLFFSTGASRVKETQQRSPWQSSTEISLGFVVILTS